jgi:hypothetical protein
LFWRNFEMAETAEKAVMTVVEAGAKLGLSRNASYVAAARGDLPVLKIGRLLKVPHAAFNKMLEEASSRTK